MVKFFFKKWSIKNTFSLHHYKCHSVFQCSDIDMILVVYSLTPKKVVLLGSELPHLRTVMISRYKQWFRSDSTFCTLERNVNFSLNDNLQVKYETKKYNINNSSVI